MTRIPFYLEPTGLYCSDGKRPDGASIMPWKAGKFLAWNVTGPDTLACSYEELVTRETSAVAVEAERRKRQKYANLKLNLKYFGGNHIYIYKRSQRVGEYQPHLTKKATSAGVLLL